MRALYRGFCVGLVVLLVASCYTRARSWDNPGHMAVVGYAYSLLTDDEKAKLERILVMHRDVSRLYDGLNTQNPGGRELAMAAATWPDLMKQDNVNYHDNGYNEHGPITAILDDRKMHKGWHFIDIPLQRDHTHIPSAPGATGVHAVTVVNQLIKQLKSGEADEQKAFDLYWLLHLVGDLHQPLHCASGYNATYPKGDTGGNGIAVTGQAHGTSELHAYWDDILGHSAKKPQGTVRVPLDKDVITANGIVASLAAADLTPNSNDLNSDHWAAEGFKLAKSHAYNLQQIAHTTKRVKQHDGTYKLVPIEKATLDDGYYMVAVKDGKQQIKLAGYRLASILKSILATWP